MEIYNVHWVEIYNVEIEAENEEEAKELWVNQEYNNDEVSRDLLDKPVITKI